MAFIVESMAKFNNYLNRYEDPRTANWPLMSSPFYTLGICLAYVYIVKVFGPNFMENRKPFQLKWTLITYNLFQVIFNAWMWYTAAMAGWLTGEYSYRCQPVDYSDNPKTVMMLHITWWYYFSKFTDFLDTIFFVMRKKNNQITTLHIIHHGIMPMTIWFGVKFSPGGHNTFSGFLNTFVHVVMYSYHLLSTFGPKVQKYLWWKKYVTTIQMSILSFGRSSMTGYKYQKTCLWMFKVFGLVDMVMQFVAILVHSLQLLFIECNYPRAFVWLIMVHAVLFFFLFKQFYNEAYINKNTNMNHPLKDYITTYINSEEGSKENDGNKNPNFKQKGKYIN